MNGLSTRVCFFACISLPLGIAGINAAETAPRDWPEGYVVQEHSTSPDGRFAVLVPGRDAAEQITTDDYPNFLADLKARQVLGKIKGADYFERQNHRGLEVVWAADSSGCVLVYQARFGFDRILALELAGSGFTETDLGEHIDKALAVAAGEQGSSSAWFRFADGKKIRARALTYTGNPKMRDENTIESRFAGTFDRVTKKWIASAAHRTKDYEVLSDAYSARHGEDVFVAPNGDESKVPPHFSGVIVNSEQEKEEHLDEEMNAVYKAVRALLPPGQFAKVKAAQIAWLKTRDATPAGQRSAMVIERSRALEEFVWN